MPGFKVCQAVLAAFLLFVTAASANAVPVKVDFESLADSEVLNTQIPGLTFSNATVLSAGVSLNEFELPPRSGLNVVFDDGGGIDIIFDSPQEIFGGYFTYLAPISLTAFDRSNNVLGSSASVFASNLALSGDAGSSPNEFLSVSFTGIRRVLIVGDSAGGSFVLDDLTMLSKVAVPEPGLSFLFLCGVVITWLMARRRSTGIALLALASLQVQAAQTVALPKAAPAVLVANQSTVMTFTVRVDDPTFIANSIVLQQLDANDRIISTLGTLRDDGIGADAAAGDKVSSLRVVLRGTLGSRLRIRASAAFRGMLKRVFSPVTQVDVISRTPTFSGVAAVGTPLAGTVSVKDAAGVIRTTPLGSNGSYSIDVSGMTAPFVFRAEGKANGHNYVVHSAATAADVGGTINITQLTDLVVDNIAGQVAGAYFARGDFSSLTPAALDAEVALLKARLLPVLLALSVDASIDLLRSRFTPLESELDAALDIVRVTLDPATNIAVITNIVTQQSILDAITMPAGAETAPGVLTDTGGVGDAPSDMDAIRAALANFVAKFATGLPSPLSISAALSAAYLHDDQDRATQVANFASDTSFIGAGFVDIDIKSIDYSDAAQVNATVDFTFSGRGGIEQDRITDFRMLKGSDGVWRLYGNQRVIEANVDVVEFRLLPGGCVRTGLNLSIEDRNSANNGGVLDHVVVFGPGLPAGGLRHNRPVTGGGDWINTVQGGNTYFLATNCGGFSLVSDAAIAAIPDSATYRFVGYSSLDDSVPLLFPQGAIQTGANAGQYQSAIEKRPLTLAEVVASAAFPVIVTPTSAQLAAYVSGPLNVAVANLNPNAYVYVGLHRITFGGDDRSVSAWLPPTSGGTASTVLSLTPLAPGDTVGFRNINVETTDQYRRVFKTGYF